MLRIQRVDSIDLPALAPYRTLRLQFEHYRERMFVAEGDKVVHRLLASGLRILSALLPPEDFSILQRSLESRPEDIEIFLAERRLLEPLTGFPMFQGLLACARIPEPVALDVVLASSPRPRFFVAGDGLANAENLGGVVRSAAAFGAHALLVGETCAHPYLRRAVRASMGTVFGLPVVETASLPEALVELRRCGVQCVAADPRGRRALPEVSLHGDCCVVLGSEADGLSESVRASCDELVALPMQTGVDSLNVAAAAAVFFYEVWRQRRKTAR